VKPAIAESIDEKPDTFVKSGDPSRMTLTMPAASVSFTECHTP
jgi:hypothetical protein